MASIFSGTTGKAQRCNKTESLSIIVNRDAQKSLSERQPNIYGGNAIWNKLKEFFWKIAIASDVFKVMVSSFQTLGTVTEKACLPKLSFVLGSISCEIDDLSCLGIFERCRRLAK